MRTIHILGIFVLLAVAVPAAPAHAGGVVSVCDEAHLLAALTGGGTVTFGCSGTITLTAEIVISVDITIDGSGQTVTISGNNAVRVFNVNSGVTLNLNGLTVADGNAGQERGGGIRSEGPLTVSNSTFSGNRALDGGGIYNDYYGIAVTATVSNSTFSGNSAHRGGGISNQDWATMTVSNSTFSGNSANHGGGLYNSDRGVLTVSRSTFSGNCCAYTGSGIFNEGILGVSNSIFSGNRAGQGGGIFNTGYLGVSNSTFSVNTASAGGGIINNINGSNGRLRVVNSTFSGNSAQEGGGIYNFVELPEFPGLHVDNSTFSGNRAEYSGGGIMNAGVGQLDVSNSTFTDNSGSQVGGAIATGYGTLTVVNTTIAGNSAIHGGGISNAYATITQENTIISNNPSDENCYGAITDGGGNLSFPDTTCPGINADPMLGPLQDNGGPTWAMALGEGSAAIDAADDAICAAPPVNNLDQRGVTRPQGLHCDIGAVEQIQEPSAVSVSALRAQSLPGPITPAMIAGLLLLVLVAVGVHRRPRHIG